MCTFKVYWIVVDVYSSRYRRVLAEKGADVMDIRVSETNNPAELRYIVYTLYDDLFSSL